jgi:hypothetical protein
MINYVSAENAVSIIDNNDKVILHGGAATPQLLVSALTSRHNSLRNVEIFHLHTEGAADYAKPEYSEAFCVSCFFVGANIRPYVNHSNVQYIPVFLSEIPSLFRNQIIHLDVAITQVSPSIPQYTQVDQPMLRDGLKAATNGRVEVTLSSWPERNVNGPEVLRLVRSGQVDIAAGPLTTVSGDVPMLDGIDLAGLNPSIKQARKVADAMMPVANKELEKLGIKLVATYPFSGQMLFCRKPIASLADLKGLKVRINGPSAGDLVKALGGQPVSLAFGEVYTALERGTVEVAPLAFMRGRTLNNSFIILDEAQNTTPEQMKMFLTRIGFGSKVVVTGDTTQVDIQGGRSGLLGLEPVLGHIDGLAWVKLTAADVVRHRIVQDIVSAYEAAANIT